MELSQLGRRIGARTLRLIDEPVAAALGDIGHQDALPALKARLPKLGLFGGERGKEVLAAIREAIEKIEKATAR